MKLGRYQHFRNKHYYRVLGVALHSETREELVVYEPLYENTASKLWVRPRTMFEELVLHEGKKVPRFSFIAED